MVQRNVGPSRAVSPPFGPIPVASVCSTGTPGCGCGMICDGQRVLRADGDIRSHVKQAARERALDAPQIVPVDPDLGGVVDAVEVQPDALSGVDCAAR